MTLLRVWLTIGGGEERGTAWTRTVPEVGSSVDVELDTGRIWRAIVDSVGPGDDAYAATVFAHVVDIA